MAEKKDQLLVKLDELERRYCEIESKVADPTIASDLAKLIALSKEQGKLKAIVTKYRDYKAIIAAL